MSGVPVEHKAGLEGSNAGFGVRHLEDGAVFTFERPEKLNALTKPMLEGLEACLDDLEAREARLLVITGRGDRAFSAGTDVAELRGMDLDASLAKSAMARRLFTRVSRSRLVSVAAVNGLAFGGGLEIAMACTLRICAEHATFSLPEVKLGLLPAYAGTQFLPSLVGPGRALDLMLTGRTVPSDEALAIGLVHRRVGDPALVVQGAIAFGREITRYSPAAVEAIRRCVEASGAGVAEAGLDVEGRQVRSVFAGKEATDGIAAFLDRRSAPR